jgi:hypothetical protein
VQVQYCSHGHKGAAWLAAGFDNIEPQIGYDNNVLNKYFNEYLPRAVSAAQALLLMDQRRMHTYRTTTPCIPHA